MRGAFYYAIGANAAVMITLCETVGIAAISIEATSERDSGVPLVSVPMNQPKKLYPAAGIASKITSVPSGTV